LETRGDETQASRLTAPDQFEFRQATRAVARARVSDVSTYADSTTTKRFMRRLIELTTPRFSRSGAVESSAVMPMCHSVSATRGLL
jgi:hypothetical protein